MTNLLRNVSLIMYYADLNEKYPSKDGTYKPTLYQLHCNASSSSALAYNRENSTNNIVNL